MLFLPGDSSPEEWVWQILRLQLDDCADRLGTSPSNLSGIMDQIDSVYDSSSDRPSRIAKVKIDNLGERLRQDMQAICRVAARSESPRIESDIQPLVEGIEDAILAWRS